MNKTILSLALVFCAGLCFAETVQITLITKTGTEALSVDEAATELTISERELVSIGGLEKLTALKVLRLFMISGAPNYSFLGAVPGLEVLVLNSCPIRDLAPLAVARGLRALIIQNALTDDAYARDFRVPALGALEYLEMTNYGLTAPPDLGALDHPILLNLSYNRIREIDAVALGPFVSTLFVAKEDRVRIRGGKLRVLAGDGWRNVPSEFRKYAP